MNRKKAREYIGGKVEAWTASNKDLFQKSVKALQTILEERLLL